MSDDKFEFDGITNEGRLLPRSDFACEAHYAKVLVARADVRLRKDGERWAHFYFVTASEDWRDPSKIIRPYYNSNTEFGLTGKVGLAGAVTSECGRAIEYLDQLHLESLFK